MLAGLALLFALQAVPQTPALEPLRRLAEVDLPAGAERCWELVNQADASLEQVGPGLGPERAAMARAGVSRMLKACEALARGGAGDPRSVALEAWRGGQQAIRRGLRLPDAEPPDPGRPGDRVLERTRDHAIFAAGREYVWSALMESLAAAYANPKVVDAASGTIFLETSADWGKNWGDVNRAVDLLTAKKVGSSSTWLHLLAQMNLVCRELDPYRTQVEANIKYRGCNGFRGWLVGGRCSWEELGSNGHLEELIFDRIARRLLEVNPPSRSPAVPHSDRQAESIVAEGWAALREVQRLDAALDVGLPRERLIEKFADAKAAVEQFAGWPGAERLPMFLSRLKEALTWYSDVMSPAPRHGSRELAKEALGLARRHLANYEQIGQETSPL